MHVSPSIVVTPKILRTEISILLSLVSNSSCFQRKPLASTDRLLFFVVLLEVVIDAYPSIDRRLLAAFRLADPTCLTSHPIPPAKIVHARVRTLEISGDQLVGSRCQQRLCVQIAVSLGRSPYRLKSMGLDEIPNGVPQSVKAFRSIYIGQESSGQHLVPTVVTLLHHANPQQLVEHRSGRHVPGIAPDELRKTAISRCVVRALLVEDRKAP